MSLSLTFSRLKTKSASIYFLCQLHFIYATQGARKGGLESILAFIKQGTGPCQASQQSITGYKK